MNFRVPALEHTKATRQARTGEEGMRRRANVHRPSWTGGVDATSRKYREASFDGADGVVDQSRENCFEPEPPPRLRLQRKLRSFFLVAQPPLLARRGDWLASGVA